MATIRYFWQCLNCHKLVDSKDSNHHCTHCGQQRGTRKEPEPETSIFICTTEDIDSYWGGAA